VDVFHRQCARAHAEQFAKRGAGIVAARRFKRE
jgi:hypothetical protein